MGNAKNKIIKYEKTNVTDSILVRAIPTIIVRAMIRINKYKHKQ